MTYLVPSAIVAYQPLESANLKIARTALPTAQTIADAALTLTAAEPGAMPGPSPEFREAGTLMRTSFRDWYFRIHILPAALNLGNVSGDVERTVDVWNAYFEPVTLEGFSAWGEGVTASTPVTPPVVIPPLEDVRYTFSISATGPAVIEGGATWTIDGVEYTVPITGRRSVLFSFMPDWKLGRVTERLEWKNTLATSFDGKREQIMRVRQVPRRSISYRLRLRDDDARLMDQSVFGWTGRLFGVPLWHEKARLQADAAEGATALALDPSHSSFVDGGAAVLFRGPTEYEMLDIAAVDGGGFTTTNSLARAWPAGTTVVPVVPGLPQEVFGLTRALPGHLDASVEFLLSPSQAPLRLPLAAAPASYRGLELYTGETNWRSPLAVEMAARRIVSDGGLGPIASRPRADFPLTSRGMLWMLKTRAAADTLRAFLARRDGIRVPAWMPSGTTDFVLAQQAEIGATALRVRRSQYGSLVGQHPARRDIVLLMRNGDRLAMRVLEANDEGEGTTLTVDTGMPYIIRPEDVKRISFLGCYRLASDAVAFDWHTPTVAEVATNFVLKVPA